MTPLDLSIIIVNFNTAGLTFGCIRSIYEKTCGVNFEIILVDNASTDLNPDVFKLEFPHLVLIKSPANVGYAKGINLGMELARGEYVLLLNSYILMTENAIGACLDKIKSDGGIGALSPKLIHKDGRAQSVANRFPSIRNQLLILTRSFRLLSALKKEELFLGQYAGHEKTLEADWVLGAFFLTKKEVIDKFDDHKLNDDYFMYFEYVEWCYDIKRLGYKVIYYPAAKAIHYASGSTESIPDNDGHALRKIRSIAKNEATFLKKRKGWLYQKIYSLLWAMIYLTTRDLELVKLNILCMFDRL
jgi:GT2 family glycosyltransferase